MDKTRDDAKVWRNERIHNTHRKSQGVFIMILLIISYTGTSN